MKLKIPNLLLVLILLLVLLTRIPLFNENAQYFFGDEIRYKRLIVTLQQAERTNNTALYLQSIFAIHARPLYAVLYSPAIWLEARKQDIPYGAILNIFVNSFMILLIYLILKKLVNIHAAILSIIAIIFSVSSVIYMRHMLPYDAGLAVLLLALYIFICTNSTFLFGVFTAFSFLVYPSYLYYLLPLPFVVLYLAKMKVRPLILFGFGCSIPILSFQLFSILIGADSYLLTIEQLNASVAELKQGDFIPAFSFLTEYIFAYDGYWGLILAFSAPLFLILIGRKKHFLPLVLYLLIVFLLLEIFSHIIPETVLYGRTVRPYYLLLLISSIIFLDDFFKNISKKSPPLYILFFSLFILITMVNWGPRFRVFKNLIYPTAFRKEAESYLLERYGKGNYKLKDVYAKKRSEADTATDPPILEPQKFYAVNPTFLYPYFGSLDTPCNKDILFERAHAILFRPYDFEGFTRLMRKYISDDPPKYQLIYCKS